MPVGTALSWHDNDFMSDSKHYEESKNFKVSWYDNGEMLSYGAFGISDSVKNRQLGILSQKLGCVL